jgi:hypothetical protein
MWFRKALYVLFLIAWEVTVRLPMRLVRTVIVLLNVWAWHVIVLWLFLLPFLTARRAGFAMATLCLTFVFRPRLFGRGFRFAAGIYAVLSGILLILLWFGTPVVAGLFALLGALRNDMDIVSFAGTLFVYLVIWLAIVGKFYEIASGLATIGQSSLPVRKDPKIATEADAQPEARAILVQQYREGL